MDLVTIFFGYVLYFLLVYWVANFVLQTDHIISNKNTSNYYLVMHVTIYTVITMLAWWILFLIVGIHVTKWQYLEAGVVMFITHLLIDYVTSYVIKKHNLVDKKHQFSVIIGFNQWLDYLQIFIVFKYIILK